MRPLIFALALAAPAVAHAQEAGHEHMHHDYAEPTQVAPPPASTPEADAGHTAPAQPAEHDHSQPAPPAPIVVEAADPHAGHTMTTEPANPPANGPPAEALRGPFHAAGARFGPAEMARARQEMLDGHGGMRTHKVILEELEWRSRDGVDGYAWEGQAWFGGDMDKLWLRTKGEGDFGGRVEKVEGQALWSRAIDPWFNLELGLRHDFRPGPDRTYAVVGVQGLAPYWLEVSAAAFVSTKGEVTARLEANYDLRITQRLILQPQVQLDLSAQDIPDLRLGSGLSTAELGLRLRYEIIPELAPYLGIHYERAIGRTADFRRGDGKDVDAVAALVGFRFWF